MVQVGDRVRGVDKSIPDVVGVFMMKMAADDLVKNCREAERLRDSLVFDIEPEDGEPVRRPSRRRYAARSMAWPSYHASCLCCRQIMI